VHTTKPGSILIAAVVGAAVALIVAVATTRSHGYPPELTLSAPGAIVVVVLALVVAVRYMRVRVRATATIAPDPHLAFRLFVLGRASTLAGAVVVGSYLALGGQRLQSQWAAPDRSQLVIAGTGVVLGVVMTTTAIILERSCRSPGDPPGGATAGSAWGPSIAGDTDDDLV
jgi:hypothetical protein